MTYNSYFPTGYQPFQIQPQAAPQQQTNIVWTQGIEGAKAHFVSAGGSALLMDSDADRFYIKTADSAGMPSLRVFKYEEITQGARQNVDMSGYVTKEEFEKRIAELMEGDRDGKQAVQHAEQSASKPKRTERG